MPAGYTPRSSDGLLPALKSGIAFFQKGITVIGVEID
jgi:hypothetical protein